MFLSERGIDGYRDQRKLKIMTTAAVMRMSAHILSGHITVIMAKLRALLTGSGSIKPLKHKLIILYTNLKLTFI